MWWFMSIILGLRRPAMKIALSCRPDWVTETLSQIIKKERKNQRKGGREKGRKLGRKTFVNFSKSGSVVLFSSVFLNWWDKQTLLYIHCLVCMFCDLPVHALQLTFSSSFKKSLQSWRDGSTVTLAAPPEVMDSVPSANIPVTNIQTWLTTTCNSSSRGSEVLFQPLHAQSTQVLCRHTFGQNTIYIK